MEEKEKAGEDGVWSASIVNIAIIFGLGSHANFPRSRDVTAVLPLRYRTGQSRYGKKGPGGHPSLSGSFLFNTVPK